jgi:hypothetical protein
MLDVLPHLPRLTPMGPGEIDRFVWKGLTKHIGPTADFTPLQKALLNKTNCALYMIYIGCVGLCSARTVTALDQKINTCLVEQIFCYQFDWRYPKPFGLPITMVDSGAERISAIRRSVAFYFFEIVERMPSFFNSNSPIADVSFMINLARHIVGAENQQVFDAWVEQMIQRMDQIAAFSEHPSPKLSDYGSRQEWEATVLKVHGAPLPLEVLNLAFDPTGKDLHGLAVAELNSINAAENPLLATPEQLKARGFTGTPYRLAP